MPGPLDRKQTLPLTEAIALGRQRHAAGALDEARHIYLSILRAAPEHPEPLSLLAAIAFRCGRDDDGGALLARAVESYSRALERDPDNAAIRAPLVNLLLAADRGTEAEALLGALELPLIPAHGDRAAFEAAVLAAQRRGLPAVLVNSIPKAASESIWNRLAAGLGSPQGHLSIGLFPRCCAVPSRVRAAVAARLVAKEHLHATPFNLAALSEHGLERVVVHVRDVRQALLSWAHFVQDDIARRPVGPLWRRSVPPAAVLGQPFERQIDWYIEHYLPLQVAFIEGWLEAAKTRPILFLTFERYLTDPKGYIEDVLSFCGIDRSQWNPAAEGAVAHLRKGEAEEWRTTFTAQQALRAWRWIPDSMAEYFGWSR